MFNSPGQQLINEALSRARTLRPQENRSEANHSARRVAMRARRETARALGSN
jgi:hypothetical protein